MRIISGYLKGRKILQPTDKQTRPLKDLTKESVFNILEHSNLLNISLKKINVLDIFSGVGSFGLECISRGAENVLFFENYSEAIKILKKNIINLKCTKQTKIIEKNIFEFKNLENISKKKFEIIFVDPPFKDENLSNLINNIINSKILAENGIIILHRHKKKIDIFPEKFKIIKTKTYGVSKIIFAN